MKDFSYAADRIVGDALAPFFSRELPPYLGQEIFLAIRRRLWVADRYLDDEHADEVFQRVVVEAYFYLTRHGSNKIRCVREWLHHISLKTTRSYLSEHSRFDPLTTPCLNIVINHETESSDDSNELLLGRVHEAIFKLQQRHQEVIRLILDEGLSSTEIQKRMKISSSAYFQKLKCEATKALRGELSKLFHSA
jgi:DNA-directed RNA polymerase specialized sigma24 family protein